MYYPWNTHTHSLYCLVTSNRLTCTCGGGRRYVGNLTAAGKSQCYLTHSIGPSAAEGWLTDILELLDLYPQCHAYVDLSISPTVVMPW